MLAHYGYKDGSGEYFIIIDTDKCDGCEECVTACPVGVFEVGEDENDPFREEPVAKVSEDHRKKIKYSCAPGGNLCRVWKPAVRVPFPIPGK